MRGQLTVSLTWMYALIAGIAVFSLLINFAMQERGSLETREANTVLDHASTQLRTARHASNSFTTIETPDVSLTIDCPGPGQTDLSAIRMDGAEAVENTRHTPLFAPERLDGQELYAWSYTWQLPYPITEFLYVADRDTMLVIDNTTSGASDAVDAFLQDLPDGFTINVTQTGQLQERPGLENARYVLFGTNAPDISPIINITQSNDGLQNGTVEINGNSLDFIGKAMLYGAVFTGDVDRYSCNVDKARTRFQNISSLNQRRAHRLHRNRSAAAPCSPPEDCDDCIPVLDELNETYKQMQSAFPQYRHAEQLENLTGQLERGSCPEI